MEGRAIGVTRARVRLACSLRGRVRTRRVELAISTLLRVGVIASLSIIVAGTILSFVHHPTYVSSSAELARLTKPELRFRTRWSKCWPSCVKVAAGLSSSWDCSCS